jgi:hypothetical protein
MTSVFSQIISWRALVAAVVVIGFAPRAVLRVIVLAFGRSDPRRRELLGELDSVPRWERPLWVAEQLEVALAEGIGSRLARVCRRWAPARRTAEWWRREKDDFLHTSYTFGYTLTSNSYFTILIYLLVLVPGTGKWIACGTWSLVGEAMAWCRQRNRKRLQPGQPVPATRLDALIFVLAGPAAYATTIYLFIHDLAALASGSLAAGYWTGVFLCLLVLWHPWHVILLAVRATRVENMHPPRPGGIQSGRSDV